jgi:putative transposase
MVKKAFKPEQIINKLREAEVLLSQGATVGEVSRKLGITEQTYYRWRREYGGMRVEQAKRLKELDKETLRKYIGGSGLAAKLMFDRIMILYAPAFPAQPSSSKKIQAPGGENQAF